MGGQESSASDGTWKTRPALSAHGLRDGLPVDEYQQHGLGRRTHRRGHENGLGYGADRLPAYFLPRCLGAKRIPDPRGRDKGSADPLGTWSPRYDTERGTEDVLPGIEADGFSPVGVGTGSLRATAGSLADARIGFLVDYDPILCSHRISRAVCDHEFCVSCLWTRGAYGMGEPRTTNHFLFKLTFSVAIPSVENSHVCAICLFETK